MCIYIMCCFCGLSCDVQDIEHVTRHVYRTSIEAHADILHKMPVARLERLLRMFDRHVLDATDVTIAQVCANLVYHRSLCNLIERYICRALILLQEFARTSLESEPYKRSPQWPLQMYSL